MPSPVYSLGAPNDFEAVIFINGRHAKRDTPLQEGDEITPYPAKTGDDIDPNNQERPNG